MGKHPDNSCDLVVNTTMQCLTMSNRYLITLIFFKCNLHLLSLISLTIFVDIKHHVYSLATRRFNFLTPLRPRKNACVINHARNGYSCSQVQIKKSFEEHNSTVSGRETEKREKKSSNSGLNQARESTSNHTKFEL